MIRWTIPLLVGCGADGGPSAGDTGPDLPVDVETIEGDVTWSLSFDDTARDAGFSDCSYTRTYTGAEDRSAPWLCTACDVQYAADVAMEPDDVDCYAQLSGGPPPPEQERLGFDETDFFRSALEFSPLGDQGPFSASASQRTVGWGATLEVAEGTAELTASGTLTLGVTEGDPWGGLLPIDEPSCGWTTAPAPPYDGDYLLRTGATLPDGTFRDQCGDPVRLHTLAGRYLVVDISAADCGPCQDMALDEPAFSAQMEADDREVQVVTLLATGLGLPFDPAGRALRNAWVDTYDVDSPVLGDRGWGPTLALELTEQLSYPTWIVVGPDLEVLAIGQGYGGWDPIADVIEQSDG